MADKRDIDFSYTPIDRIHRIALGEAVDLSAATIRESRTRKLLAGTYSRLASSEFDISNITEAVRLQKLSIRLMSSNADCNLHRLAESYRFLGLYFMAAQQWNQAAKSINRAIDYHMTLQSQISNYYLAKCFACLCYIESKVDLTFQFDVFYSVLEQRFLKNKLETKQSTKNKEFAFVYFSSMIPDRILVQTDSFYFISPLIKEYYRLVEQLVNTGGYDQAIKAVKRILKLHQTWRKEDQEDKLIALFELVGLYRVSSRIDDSMKTLEEISEIIHSNPGLHISYEAALYYQRGLNETEMRNMLEARQDFVKAISLFEHDENFPSSMRGRLLYHLAMAEKDLGNYSSTETHLLKSLEVYKTSHDDRAELAEIYWALADVNCMFNHYQTAMAFLFDAVKVLEEKLSPDHKFIATLYKRLAGLAHQEGDIIKAKQYRYKYYEHQIIDPKDIRMTVINYYRRAELLIDLGHSDGGIPFLEEAIRLHKEHKLKDEPWVVKMYVRLGRHYTTMGEYLKAIRMFNHALKIEPSSDVALYSLAQMYEKRNKRDDFKKEKALLKKLMTMPQEEEVQDFLLSRLYALNHR